jgi:hypothetical protein
MIPGLLPHDWTLWLVEAERDDNARNIIWYNFAYFKYECVKLTGGGSCVSVR